MTDDNNSNNSNNGNNGQSNSGALGKFGAVAVGLIMLLFGLGMVIPSEGAGTSGMERALGALVTALGGGVIATVLLPHSIEVDGKNVKPFGVDLKASGGAAVFVLSLLFAFFGAQALGDKPEPTPTPTETASPNPDATPAGDETSDPEPEQTTQATPPSSAPTQAQQGQRVAPDEIEPGEDFGQSYDFIENAAAAPGVYRYMTYCPMQCPAGPEFCPSLAWGQNVQRIAAQEIAVSYCVSGGGVEACCRENLEQF